jgi:hypothetical protein
MSRRPIEDIAIRRDPVSVGMAVAAGGFAFASGTTLAVIGITSVFWSAVAIAGISLALGFVSRAIEKKAKAPDLGNFAFSARDRSLTVRQPAGPWRVIYGSVPRLGGTLTFVGTSGASNEFLHLVITLAGHQVETIDTMYFDGEEVPLDGSGDATGKYANLVHVEKNLGSADQAAFAGLIAAGVGWTSAHRQRGRAGAYVRLKWDADKFGGIPNITFDMDGKNDVYDPRPSPPTRAFTANWALCLADYLCDTTRGLDANYASEIEETLLTAAANVADEQVSVAAGGSENRYGTNGTLTLDQKPVDIINAMLSAGAGRLVKSGARWRIHAGAWPGATGGAWGDGDLRGPIQVTGRISRRENFNAVRGIIASPDTQGQPADFPPVRNGLYETEDSDRATTFTSDSPFDALLLDDLPAPPAATALLFETTGTLPDGLAPNTVFYAVNDTETSIKVATSRANALAGTAIDILDGGTGTHTVRFGQAVFKDIDLPFTGSIPAAQRLAKIELERARQPITVRLPMKLRAYAPLPGDVIALTHDRFGWSGKEFEVVERTLAAEPGGLVGVDWVVRETASEVFDWSAGEETAQDPAPDTNLPDPFTVINPTGLTVATVTNLTQDQDVLRQVALGWNAPADIFVTSGGDIEVQWKLSSSSGWQPSFTVKGNQTLVILPPLFDLGLSIDVQIRSINNIGRTAQSWLGINGYEVGSSAAGVDSRYDFGRFSDQPSPITSYDFGLFSDQPSPITSYDFGNF